MVQGRFRRCWYDGFDFDYVYHVDVVVVVDDDDDDVDDHNEGDCGDDGEENDEGDREVHGKDDDHYLILRLWGAGPGEFSPMTHPVLRVVSLPQ